MKAYCDKHQGCYEKEEGCPYCEEDPSKSYKFQEPINNATEDEIEEALAQWLGLNYIFHNYD